MNIFSHFFETRAPVATALEDFLATLTSEHAQITYHSVKEQKFRLSTAISSIALFIVNKFMVGYSEMIRSTCKAAGTPAAAVPFDAVAFEVAAYVHYWLMRDQLRRDDEVDYDEDEDDDEDPYFTCLRQAALISESLIQRYSTLTLPEQFFINRVISYSANKTPSELFLRVLLSTQTQGKPGSVKAPSAPDLPADLAAISYVGIFHKSYLQIMTKNAQDLYVANKAGLL